MKSKINKGPNEGNYFSAVMLESFFKKNLPLIALIVAILGGLPGSINSYRYFFGGPKIIFQVKSVQSGSFTVEPGDKVVHFLLLNFILANNSEINFSPVSYHFALKTREGWKPLKSMFIPSNLNGYHDENISITANLQKSDILQIYRPVSKDNPIFANAMFMIDELIEETLKNNTNNFALQIDDIFKKSYKIEDTFSGNPSSFDRDDNWYLVFPQQGIKINPKKPPPGGQK